VTSALARENKAGEGSVTGIPQPSNIRSLRNKAVKIADILEEFLGRPALSGRRSKPLDTLIATLLSQNTNDRNSHQAWLNLKRQFPRWKDVASAPVRQIARTIEVGGLKNQKAQRIKKILEIVRKDAGRYDLGFLKGKTNEEVIAYLTTMKGVGMKTAACVLVFSMGRDVFPVDTHIHRICNRLGLVIARSAEQTFEQMQAIVPPRRAYSFHVNLIRFGRKVCRSQNPLCGACTLYDRCTFPEKEHHAAKSPPGSGRSGTNPDFIVLDNLR
jgi:endonuclease-3